MRRRAAIALTLVVLLAVAAGCSGGGGGGGGASASGVGSGFSSLATELNDWFRDVKPVVNELDQSEISVTRFHISEPPVGDLFLISRSGVAAGRDARVSANQMFLATYLTKREVKSLYCFFFSWYVTNGTIPTNPREFVEALFSYVKDRLLPTTTPQQVYGIANLFRGSIVNAMSAGEAAARVAVATACSLPTR